MIIFMKENGKVVNGMARESLFIQMVMNMKENGNMMKGMARESAFM